MAGMKKIRPIDANTLAESIKRYMKNYRNVPTRLTVCRSILSMLGDENQTPTLTDHFPDVKKMVPLTLEQLREFDGKPAYWAEDDSWGIISVDSAGPWTGMPFFRGRKFGVNFEYDIKSRGMEVYAYKPAHIDREAWEPCMMCENPSSLNRFLEMNCRHCPKCGRPLTEKAWTALEKRLRG